MDNMTNGLTHWADILVLVLYFITVLAVGLWSMRRPNRGNVNSYFLAGRSMPWFAVGASLFATNIGCEHFVGMAGAAATSGIAMILFEWLSVYLLVLCGWCFLPVFISSGVYTIPEYMEKRYGGRLIRNYVVMITLFFAIVTKLSGNMFAGALFIQLSTGWNMYLSVIVLLVITTLYTMLGGLAAVIYTDTLQAGIMMIGAFVMTGYCYNQVGSWSELKERYMVSMPSILHGNNTCGFPNPDAFSLYHNAATGDVPWTGIIAMSTLGSVFYWCGDQVIAQRFLAARNLQNAKGGSVFASVLKILTVFIMIIPGMTSRVLFPDEVACVDPDECMRICNNPSGCSNIAYPKLVLELLPTGLKGLLMAVIMSAIMSSLTSIFNSSSTVFTLDLWRQFRSQASQRELLIVGRIFVVFMCCASIAWLPLIRGSQGGQLYSYLTMILSCLMEPMSSAFALSVFWKRTTKMGVFYGLLISHAVGIVRLVIELMYPTPPCGMPETRPAFLYRVNFMNFGAMLILFSGIVIIIISLLTKPNTEEQLQSVTFWTRMKVPPPIPPTTDSEMVEDSREMDNVSNEQAHAENTDNGEGVSEKPSSSDDNNVPEMNGVTKTRSISWRECLLVFLLGSSDKEHNIMEMTFEQKKEFLSENKRWSLPINLSAFIIMAIMFFLLGYFR